MSKTIDSPYPSHSISLINRILLFLQLALLFTFLQFFHLTNNSVSNLLLLGLRWTFIYIFGAESVVDYWGGGQDGHPQIDNHGFPFVASDYFTCICDVAVDVG